MKELEPYDETFQIVNYKKISSSLTNASTLYSIYQDKGS